MLTRTLQLAVLAAAGVLLAAAVPAKAQVTYGAASNETSASVNSATANVQTGSPAVTVSASPAGSSLATLEIRPENAIMGAEVRLRHVARWPRKDNGFFAPLADVVIGRFGPTDREMRLDLSTIRTVLDGAGLPGTEVTYRGAVTIKLTRLDFIPAPAPRSDAPQMGSLEEFLAKNAPAATEMPAAETNVAIANAASLAAPAREATPAAPIAAEGAVLASSTIAPLMPVAKGEVVSLKQRLINDVVNRLSVSPENLEVVFDPKDAAVLRLSEPAFRFQISPMRVRNLGPIVWTVDLLTGTQTRRVDIAARAKAWQTQLIVTRALVQGQVMTESDFEVKRVLSERMPEEGLLTREQAVAMQAARNLPVGTVLTARMVTPVLLVKPNQLVSVTTTRGAFEIRTVARALEFGGYGATIRCRSESNNEIFQVTVTGPQAAQMTLGTPDTQEVR